MSDFRKEREFYLKHIFGPIKGRIQILNLKKQEIGYLKIKPFSKYYPLYFRDSSEPVLTINERRFSSKFSLYWGKEAVDSQYIGSVTKEKNALKEIYDFLDAQSNGTIRIKCNLSGTKIRIDKNLKMKKKGKRKFHIEIESATSDLRTIIYLALCCYLIMLFDARNVE
jgi:hypothetical protein